VHAEDLEQGGPISDVLRELAAKNGLTVIAGGMPERSGRPDRPYNTSVVFGADGELVTRYRKLHLFDVELPDGTRLHESAATTAGDEVVTVDVRGFNVGLTICYDLRFGALFSALVNRGIDVLTIPAAFTQQTGMDHWHVLLRARAIETQSWLVAAAQWGQHPPNRRSYGHSLISDPWGIVVAQSSYGEGVILADCEREVISRVRRRLPCRQHLREL
jgi:predicted amidohydrolase